MHRLDVEVERKIPVFVRAFQHGAVVHEAGRVEQDIGLAGAPGHRGDRSTIAGIEFRDFGNAFALQRGKFALVDVGGEYGGAFARKRYRAGAANSNGGSGDERTLALQTV